MRAFMCLPLSKAGFLYLYGYAKGANTIGGVDGGCLLQAIALEQAFERLLKGVLSQQGKLDLHLYLDLPL